MQALWNSFVRRLTVNCWLRRLLSEVPKNILPVVLAFAVGIRVLIVSLVARLKHVEIEPALAVKPRRRLHPAKRMESHQVVWIGLFQRTSQRLPDRCVHAALQIAS